MKSKEFILSFLDGKIQRGQPLGIVSVKNEYPQEFFSGYFRRGAFPSSKYTLGLELNNHSSYVPSEDKICSYSGIWHVDDENETIFTDKESFENRMQDLMVPVLKKDNFPLFIRNLSRMDWRKL